MTELDKQILQKASGETRLNPDEQRRYFGTFRERVVLVATLEQARDELYMQAFSSAISQLKENYNQLTLKISPKLATQTQIFYMKQAQDEGLAATIVQETSAKSPYGFVLHSNQAENIENPDFAAQFPQLLTPQPKATEAKPTFFQRLFGKK